MDGKKNRQKEGRSLDAPEKHHPSQLIIEARNREETDT